jgi:hypothetical protein
LAVGDRDVDVLTADYEIVPTDRSMHWITDSNNLSENIEIEITNDSFYIEKDYSVYLFTNTTDFDVTFVNNSDYINVGTANFTIAKGHTAHVYVIQPLGQFWINYLTDGVSGGNLSSLIKQEFTYTSGAQTFTLTEAPSAIYAVFVNGQELNSDQFSIATNVLTIIDTLNSGDKVNILYSGQPVGVIPSYTKVETDALLDDKISKHVGVTYSTNAIQTVTQAEYDALTPNASTLYFII